MKKRTGTDEDGTLILEATFSLFVTMVVMIFLLSVGFLLYQRVLVTVVANQAATNVAQTYKLWNVSDNSSLSKEDVTDVKIFRGMVRPVFDYRNAKKAQWYVEPRLRQTSLARPANALKVTVKSIHDDTGRNHYEVTVTQKYVFLFGDILNLFGMRGYDEISAVSIVEAQDMMGYISTVKLLKYVEKKSEKSTIVQIINNAMGIIESVADTFNNTSDDEFEKYREDQAKKDADSTANTAPDGP